MDKGKKNMARALGLGTAAALVIYLLTLALAAYGTVSGHIGEGLTTRTVWLCAALAAFAGALTAGWGHADAPLLPLLGAVSFWACVAVLGILTAEAPEPRRAVELLAASLLGGLLAQLLVRRRGGRRTKRRASTRSRR